MKRLIPLCLLLILTACATPTPAPDPDAPILIGVQALPKALATVPPTNTPLVQATPTDDGSRPTPTGIPPTITPTPTPMIGIFSGVQTSVSVEGTFTWIATRGPKVVIVTLRPGTKTPPPSLAGVPIANVPTAIGGGIVPINPIAGTPGVARNCPTPVAPQFAGAFARFGAIGDRIGCPVKGAFGLKFVSQPFQNGVMFWRETKEMFALSTANTYTRVMDSWNETIPANDPTLVPPAGLLQPVRGFGYAWRSNPNIRNALGWATSNEQQFDGTWQDFERGFMITGLNGAVYAMIPVTPDSGQHLGTMTN